MEDEWEQIDLVTGKPREVDLDLVLDPSMHGRYRMEQIQRWRADPGYFMYRDVAAMSAAELLALRRKELTRQQLTDFKEGTHVRRGDDGTEAED